jgi:hypothetical protein
VRALTLTQPWASLVACGAKRVETRSWSTRYHGPLAIHAARAFPPSARAACLRPSIARALVDAGLPGADDLPLGVVLAVCRLTACRLIAGAADRPPPPESEFGDYTTGRFAWLLDAVHPLPHPVAARGRLGLWEWDGGMQEREPR